MKTSHIVEGYGPLDLFLARQRYRLVKRKIRLAKKTGRILDIGCGSYPMFLTLVDFREKYGLDKNIYSSAVERMKKKQIFLKNYVIEKINELPFETDFFDVVTMLAVFEHIEPNELVKIHREILRVLKPGGLYVMTTPAFWTDELLKLLAKMRLISALSISEHKDSYSHRKISSVLQEAGFEEKTLRFGFFELMMNSWTIAMK
jgi:ubiquinone/menaquinone biosynthesis C-methylase UbiE